LRDNEVTYGESLPSVGTGEIPPGDNLPYEFILVILLAAIDRVEVYEPLRGPEAVEEIDPDAEWYLCTGETCAADSRRRRESLALPLCSDASSSLGGEEARLFWPVATPDEEYTSERYG
jgi:hypothetical protein